MANYYRCFRCGKTYEVPPDAAQIPCPHCARRQKSKWRKGLRIRLRWPVIVSIFALAFTPALWHLLTNRVNGHPPGKPPATQREPIDLLALAQAEPAKQNAQEDSKQDAVADGSLSADANNNEDYQQALTDFREQKFDAALKHLQAARKRQPELPPERFMLAEMFLSAQQLPAGRAQLEQVAADQPQFAGTFALMGQIALAEGRLSDASLNFQHAATLVEELSTPEYRRLVEQKLASGRTAIAERRGNWQRAREQLTAWLEDHPDDIASQQRLARALVHLKQTDAALAQLRKAAEKEQQVMPEVSMAIFCTQSGDLEAAEKWISQAQRAFPHDGPTQAAIARWLLDRDRFADAQGHAAEALRQDEKSLEYQLLCGTIARMQEKPSDAARHFEAALRDSPGLFNASNQLALVLIDSKDEVQRRRAQELAEVNARQYPRSPDALATLGWVYYRLGRMDEAEKILQAVISTGRASSETAYYLAHVLADRGRLEDARKLLQGAVNTGGLFAYRPQAKAWLERIEAAQKAPGS